MSMPSPGQKSPETTCALSKRRIRNERASPASARAVRPHPQAEAALHGSAGHVAQSALLMRSTHAGLPKSGELTVEPLARARPTCVMRPVPVPKKTKSSAWIPAAARAARLGARTAPQSCCCARKHFPHVLLSVVVSENRVGCTATASQWVGSGSRSASEPDHRSPPPSPQTLPSAPESRDRGAGVIQPAQGRSPPGNSAAAAVSCSSAR